MTDTATPHLLIRIKRASDGSAALSCVRAGGSTTWQRQLGATGAVMPAHDLTHYAVESVLGYRRAFYGLVADGWDIDDFAAPYPRGPIPEEAREAEMVVGVFDTERMMGGNWSPAIEAAARTQHMTPLKWTVDPRDWSRPGVNTILTTVYAELRPGGVILCHDGGGNRTQTVAALKILLARLPAMGYHFVVPPAAS